MALFTYSRQWLGNGCMHLFTSAFLHVKQLLLLYKFNKKFRFFKFNQNFIQICLDCNWKIKLGVFMNCSHLILCIDLFWLGLIMSILRFICACNLMKIILC